MKKALTLLTALLLIMTMSGCRRKDAPKIAIVYFSATGNTERVAEELSSQLDGFKYTLIPEKPYSEMELSYDDPNERTKKELADNVRVEYQFLFENPNQYDYIFIGYPIWWSAAPRIITTFLSDIRLDKSVTVIPFCTSGSSPIEDTLEELKALQKDCNWLEGKRFFETFNAQEITDWVKSLKIE